MQQVLLRNQQAVAGVIEALLLVALVATIISTIQLYYIPEIMKEREAEHMDEVSNQFSNLKAMIDIQTSSESNVPIFSILTLGSRELPYFLTAPGYGYINVETSGDEYIELDGNTKVADLTSITYRADNSYFNDQTYSLQGGGIVIAQPDEGSAMRVNPTVNYTENGAITIHFILPEYVDFPGKNSSQGLGKCVIRTNHSKSLDPITYYPTLFFRMYTDYPEAWNQTFSDLLGDKATVEETDTYVEIKPLPTGKDVELELTIIKIYAQIGPGWIIDNI